MESEQIFKKSLKEISDFSFGYGVDVVGIENFQNGKVLSDLELQNEFLKSCNKGFKIAQNLIVNKTIYYQNLEKKNKVELKKVRNLKEKNLELKIYNTITIIQNRLQILKHIADGIVWQIIGGQIHIARRLHTQTKGSKILTESNIKNAVEIANKINIDENKFALISDLTTIVQIGDLLIRDKYRFGVMELKDGEVNKEVERIINELKSNNINFNDLKSNLSAKTIDQINRVIKQEKKLLNAIEVINNDKGTDPVGSGEIIVYTPVKEIEKYHLELSKLETDIRTKNWSYTIIDRCLHIGFYKITFIQLSDNILKEILKEETNNYIIIDLRQIIYQVSEPLFGKSLSPELVLNILTGEVKVLIGLNVDKMIEYFNLLGLESRWMTKKETMRAKESTPRKGILEVNNKAISVKAKDGKENVLMWGIFSKIFFDSITPKSIAESFLYRNEPR